MLGKAAVLKILGDAVRSYSNVAKIIIEFRFQANKSPLIKEVSRSPVVTVKSINEFCGTNMLSFI